MNPIGQGVRTAAAAMPKLVALALALSLHAAPASAAEFMSVGVAAAVLYDGPSARARKLFVAPRGTPLEVLSVVEPFAKVRDADGDVLWVQRAALSAERTVLATTRAVVRAAAVDTAPIVLVAARGVLLELVAAGDPDWVQVRHADGASGFVRIREVWGL